MIKCDCGNLFYSPKEARKVLQISGATLNRLRDDGWIKGEYHSVGYVYNQKELEFLQQELNRRTTNIEISTEVRSHDGSSNR